MRADARSFGHMPVLLREAIALLTPRPGEDILDVTLGLGGHSEAFLAATQPDGRLTAIDADTENMAIARRRLSDSASRLTAIHANFIALPGCLPEDSRRFDVVFADLGLSSPHVDDPSRGFTFRTDTPLDMRYDRTRGMTASDILQQWDPVRLLEIFRLYGELPKARRLVDAIVIERSVTTLASSSQLVSLAKTVYGHHAADVLPQVFQALRIAVNTELAAVERLLEVGPLLLKPGGRLGIITYHSLEDGLVKNRFRELATSEKHPVTGQDISTPDFESLTKKGIAPDETEVRNNPRSRSARLRATRRRTV